MTVTQTGGFVGAQVGPLLSKKSVVTALPATGNTDVLELPTLGLKNIGVAFTPAVNAIDAFIVSAKFHPDDTYHTLYNAITSTPAGLIIAASGTLASTGAGTTAWFTMDVRGIYSIKISVSGSTDDTGGITLVASGSR